MIASNESVSADVVDKISAYAHEHTINSLDTSSEDPISSVKVCNHVATDLGHTIVDMCPTFDAENIVTEDPTVGVTESDIDFIVEVSHGSVRGMDNTHSTCAAINEVVYAQSHEVAKESTSFTSANKECDRSPEEHHNQSYVETKVGSVINDTVVARVVNGPNSLILAAYLVTHPNFILGIHEPVFFVEESTFAQSATRETALAKFGNTIKLVKIHDGVATVHAEECIFVVDHEKESTKQGTMQLHIAGKTTEHEDQRTERHSKKSGHILRHVVFVVIDNDDDEQNCSSFALSASMVLQLGTLNQPTENITCLSPDMVAVECFNVATTEHSVDGGECKITLPVEIEVIACKSVEAPDIVGTDFWKCFAVSTSENRFERTEIHSVPVGMVTFAAFTDLKSCVVEALHTSKDLGIRVTAIDSVYAQSPEIAPFDSFVAQIAPTWQSAGDKEAFEKTVGCIRTVPEM